MAVKASHLQRRPQRRRQPLNSTRIEEVTAANQTLKIRVPQGWEVTQNDPEGKGALIVLRERTSAEPKPAITVWLRGADQLAKRVQRVEVSRASDQIHGRSVDRRPCLGRNKRAADRHGRWPA